MKKNIKTVIYLVAFKTNIFYSHYNIQKHLGTRATFYIQPTDRVWGVRGSYPLATTLWPQPQAGNCWPTPNLELLTLCPSK